MVSHNKKGNPVTRRPRPYQPRDGLNVRRLQPNRRLRIRTPAEVNQPQELPIIGDLQEFIPLTQAPLSFNTIHINRELPPLTYTHARTFHGAGSPTQDIVESIPSNSRVDIGTQTESEQINTQIDSLVDPALLTPNGALNLQAFLRAGQTISDLSPTDWSAIVLYAHRHGRPIQISHELFHIVPTTDTSVVNPPLPPLPPPPPPPLPEDIYPSLESLTETFNSTFDSNPGPLTDEDALAILPQHIDEIIDAIDPSADPGALAEFFAQFDPTAPFQ